LGQGRVDGRRHESSSRTFSPYVSLNMRLAASQMNGSLSHSTPSMSKITPSSFRPDFTCKPFTLRYV
jgi:hypothetical protein